MPARTGQWLLIAGGVVVFGALMFAAGWSVAARPAAASLPPTPAAPAQALPPIQEMIPIPGPDQGQGQGGEQCDPVILFYYEGRLYQLMPGPQQDQQGRPSSPPEYFPIRPYQGPQIPGLPFQLPPGGAPRQPQGPGFQPVQPRF